MKKRVSLIINGLVIASMLLALLVAQPVSSVTAQSGPEGPFTPPASRGNSVITEAGITKEEAYEKLDPSLRQVLSEQSKDWVNIYVSVQGGADLTPYLQHVITRPAVFNGLRSIYGKAKVSDLMKIASQPGVLAVVNTSGELREKPYDPEQEEDLPRTFKQQGPVQSNGQDDASAQGWFDVQDGHNSKAAWQKGFTGEGVIVGILDDGIDFAHPDLQGTYAWVTDEVSPYYGWPMAFSQVSTYYFAYEVLLQAAGARGISEGWAGSRWSDTSFESPAVGGKINYAPVGSTTHEYTVPATSVSGIYKLGSLNEGNLQLLFGERVAILVVDEHQAGIYDTVYVDLDNDFDFTNELPATKDSPEVWNDYTGDGVADISGGLVAWISDGMNPPPVVEWLWGITCGMETGTLKACPDNGELVIFAGAFDAGYTHGTQCASNVAGQGMISGGESAQPFAVGGMVQGAAPNVGLMDFGNHYYQGTDEDEFLVAALGYDGIPQSGDEVQITSNSYGSFTQMWGGWGYIGRLVTALNMTVAPTTVWVFSAGNEGPGFGPQEGENGPTIIKAGSSTQYGSTAWDSIAEADQIVYGDPNSFFSHGPNRDGSSGLDLLGNGGRGAGDEGLNYFAMARGFFDGASSWATWGGTSRSAPVIAGNLALLYQAYHDRTGRWPTWDRVKQVAKSAADNVVSSPFFQGAGVMNADRATDIAGGLYGVYTVPDEWQVGDWEGEEYLNFAKVAYPGDTFTKNIIVSNPSDYDITVSVDEGVMTLIDDYEFTFTTKGRQAESPFNFHSPDYLIPFDADSVPEDAEVMIVRYIQPYDNYDQNGDYATAENSWRFLFYNWTDQDGDGLLWDDANGNGAVNFTGSGVFDNDGFEQINYAASEIDEGEYVRMDYQFGGTGIPIIIHDPVERMGDGYFFGFQHRNVSPAASTTVTTFKVGVEFYKLADWQWLNLDSSSVFVKSQTRSSFNATMSIPVDAAPGIYEGVILVTDPGEKHHEGHESALPVVVNVIADLHDGGSVTLGGEPAPAGTMYQNSFTHGYFNWYGGGWTGAGDWRHYFLNLDEEDVSAGNLLVHTSWENVPTDINTWVLGPKADCASNGVTPCAWYQPGLGQPDTEVFGPYTLAPIAGSDIFRTGATYPFDTTTGGPDDWLLAPLSQAGLHEVALHNVVYAGEDLLEPFQVEVGTIDFTAAMDPQYGTLTQAPLNVTTLGNEGKFNIEITPTLALPDLFATLEGGLSSYAFGPFSTFVVDNGGSFSAWNSNNTVEPLTVSQVGATQLSVLLNVEDAGATQDPDMFLVYDVNNDGVATQGADVQVGSSGSSAGTNEAITLNNPPLGQYLVVIAGYNVDPDSGVSFDWSYSVTAPAPLPSEEKQVSSESIAVSDDPDPFDPATAGYHTTVTVDHRAAALFVDLTGIADGNDVDLYVTDGDDQVVASSLTAGSADEHVTILPVDPGYRIVPGTEYTIWVHGKAVTGTINPTLTVREAALNVWLSEKQPDVHVSDIGPGEQVETAVITVNYAMTGWQPGDFISARLVAGPSVLPEAFDKLITITLPADVTPQWDPGNLLVSITPTSDRGVSMQAYWNLGGVPLPTALIGPGEKVTYTVQVVNNNTVASPELAVVTAPVMEDYLAYWDLIAATSQVNQVNGVAYGLETGEGVTDLDNLFVWEGELGPGESVEYSYWVEMPGSMAVMNNHTAAVDVYLGSAWLTWDLAGAFMLPFDFFGMAGSAKTSSVTTAAQGSDYDYTIHLTNPSAENRVVTIVDTLPAEVSLVSNPDMDYDPVSRTLSWTGELPGAAAASKDLTFTVKASNSVPDGEIVENQAVVWLQGATSPFRTLTASTMIDDGLLPNLAISKKVDRLVAKAGDELHYTVRLTNTGKETAYNARLLDLLPAELELLPETVENGLVGDNWVAWEGDLAVGVTVEINFTAVIRAGTPVNYAIYNVSTAWADNHPAVVYNSAHTEMLVRDAVKVDIDVANYYVRPGRKAVLEARVAFGDTATYLDEVLTDSLVKIDAPAGVDLEGVTIEAFAVSGSTETSLGTVELENGQTTFWLSEFGAVRPSIKQEAGKTYDYRFKFTVTQAMTGKYSVSAQVVGATSWNFDQPENWVVGSNEDTESMFVGYPIFMPGILK